MKKETLQNDSLLKALALQPTPYTPIWLMRQAGRYLPEYNKTRARAGSFLKLAKSPDACRRGHAAAARALPARRRHRLFRHPHHPGCDGPGPGVRRRRRPALRAARFGVKREIAQLEAPDLAQLQYVFDAVRESKRALAGRVPLIGFSGSPFTLACYMVEGAGSDNWRTLKTMLHTRPDLLHRILEVNARAVADYLNAQIEAGRRCRHAVRYVGRNPGPRGLRSFLSPVFARNFQERHQSPHHPLHQRRKSVAWRDDAERMRRRRPGLDVRRARRAQIGWRPHRASGKSRSTSALFAPPERVREAARKVLESFGAAPGPRLQSRSRNSSANTCGISGRACRRSARLQQQAEAQSGPRTLDLCTIFGPCRVIPQGPPLPYVGGRKPLRTRIKDGPFQALPGYERAPRPCYMRMKGLPTELSTNPKSLPAREISCVRVALDVPLPKLFEYSRARGN